MNIAFPASGSAQSVTEQVNYIALKYQVTDEVDAMNDLLLAGRSNNVFRMRACDDAREIEISLDVHERGFLKRLFRTAATPVMRLSYAVNFEKATLDQRGCPGEEDVIYVALSDIRGEVRKRCGDVLPYIDQSILSLKLAPR